ncbi:hypothetical protein NL317_31850, partial [Klebsiella pneumoniae]|nr:hypothetical protein [Klebsiella pneumoniae]
VTSGGVLESISLGGAGTGGHIQNGGLLLGNHGPAISIEDSTMPSITNTGTITATNSGTLTAGILVDSATVQGSVSNSGT